MSAVSTPSRHRPDRVERRTRAERRRRAGSTPTPTSAPPFRSTRRGCGSSRPCRSRARARKRRRRARRRDAATTSRPSSCPAAPGCGTCRTTRSRRSRSRRTREDASCRRPRRRRRASRSTATAVRSGTWSAYTFEPYVVRTPAVSKRSLTASVRPDSGPGSASAGSTRVMKAFQRSSLTGPPSASRSRAVSGVGLPSSPTWTTTRRPSTHSSPSRVISKRHVIDVSPSRSGRDPHVDLVLEAKHLVELRLRALARVVAPALEDAELAAERRLGLLRPAKRVREVDAPAGVRVHPRHPQPLDVLYGHVTGRRGRGPGRRPMPLPQRRSRRRGRSSGRAVSGGRARPSERGRPGLGSATAGSSEP